MSELRRCTGLRDKHGELIYEHDVVGVPDVHTEHLLDDGSGPSYDVQTWVVVTWDAPHARFLCVLHPEAGRGGDYISEALDFATIDDLVGLDGLEIVEVTGPAFEKGWEAGYDAGQQEAKANADGVHP